MNKKAKKKQSKERITTKISKGKQLEKATEAYFNSLSGEALKEENELGAALAHAASRVNFDEDY